MYTTKRRKAMEAVSSSLGKFWKEWDLRVMVLLSLNVQILLIFLGNRRKYRERLWITIVVWSAYSAADSVATFALGVISNNLGDRNGEIGGYQAAKNNELTAFWAPFLLLHLGGPDTITAYALEDNELWLRHLLGLVTQTGVAVYVIFITWTGSYLSVLNLVMLLAGFIKYGERTWALRSASFEKLRETSRNEINIMSTEVQLPAVDASSPSDEDKLLIIAYRLQNLTKCFFVDSILGSRDSYSRDTVFRSLSFKDAFRIIEIQLGFYYDLFYTKSAVLYTTCGLCLRLISFSLTCLALLLLSLLGHNQKHKYSRVDVSITFLLLAVAIILEIYSALIILSSDQFAVWLVSDNKKKRSFSNLKFPICKSSRAPRWSNRMPQLNLISLCMKEKSLPCHKILKLLSMDEKVEKQWYVGYKDVPRDLKELIFRFLKFKVQKERGSRFATIPRSEGLEYDFIGEVLNKNLWQIILLFHIATEVAYYRDKEALGTMGIHQHCKLVNRISRYTVYLLINCPYMLSTDQISETVFQQTVNHIRSLLGETQLSSRKEACNRPMNANFDSNSANAMSILKVPVLRRLMESVQREEVLENWEGLGRHWLEILVMAAGRCKGNHHAQHLSRGGEFITHVWLLIAHFGLTLHFSDSD